MANRTWTIAGRMDDQGNVVEEVDPDLVAQKMLDIGTLLLTIGGTVNIAPARVKRPGPLDHNYATIGVVFTWNSFAPAAEAAEVDRPGVDDERPPEDVETGTRDEETEVSEDFNLGEPQPVES